MTDPSRINRALYDALVAARTYVYDAWKVADLANLPVAVAAVRRAVLDQVDGAIADAQGQL